MKDNIKKDLILANEYKTYGNYKQALEIYERYYNENPETLKFKDKNNYAWLIYRTSIKNFKSEEELFKSVEFITDMLPQLDMTRYRSCAYTSAVIFLLNYLDKQEQYWDMLYWIEKIDPELLDTDSYRRYGRFNKPKREKYFDWATKAYLKCSEYEKCIETCELALKTLKSFRDDGDTWYRWRIAKSLKALNKLDESLDYFLKVIEVKHEWYMYREIAETYYLLKNPLKALEYACPAVLSNVSNNTKVNLYYLIYNILKSFNQKQALKHAQLFYLLKKEKGYSIPYEIEKLGFDENNIDKKQLEREITDIWTKYKFKDQKPHHGTIIKFFEDKNYGFIKSDESTIFFHRDEFRDDFISIGAEVSFYTEDSFDKTKNQKSTKAVHIKSKRSINHDH